jgi:hypothetical protein
MNMKTHRSFADVRDAIFAPKPAQRARGGRIEVRVSDNPDVYKEASGDAPYAEGDPKTPKARGKRRAAGPRGRTALGLMTGGGVKYRADRRARRRASGGSSGSGSNSIIPPELLSPTFTITHGNGPPPPPAIPADQSAASLNALANMFAKAGSNNQSNNNNNQPVDLGYAIYSNGTPIGIKGVAPFAGGPDDISTGAKHGGRVHQRKRKT